MVKGKRKRFYSIWRKGRLTARGYYVRKKMSGPRRFRLREIKSKVLHCFDAPVNAKNSGWKCTPVQAR